MALLATEHFGLLAVGVDRFRYKDIIFHCIIPNFLIQGGDINHKYGFGGQSLCGNTFHSKHTVSLAENMLHIFFVAEFSKDDDIQCRVLTMENATGNRTASQFFIHLGPNLWMKGSSTVISK